MLEIGWWCEDCEFHTHDEQLALLHSDAKKHSLARGPVARLVRVGPPSRGDVIHRDDCRVLQRVRGKVLPWRWADKNPDVDWLALGHLVACKICKPPSPASS